MLNQDNDVERIIILQNGDLKFGLMGSVESIPSAVSLDTVVVWGQTLRNAMNRWGEILRIYNGKNTSNKHDDYVSNFLGYWMDNGAYYYYNPLPNQTYEVSKATFAHFSCFLLLLCSPETVHFGRAFCVFLLSPWLDPCPTSLRLIFCQFLTKKIQKLVLLKFKPSMKVVTLKMSLNSRFSRTIWQYSLRKMVKDNLKM